MQPVDLTFTDEDWRETFQVLSGKTVAIVHPAWHTCGTYAVVLAQAAAYRRLGANVVTVACSDQPGFVSKHSRLRRSYIAMTPEIASANRMFAGAPLSGIVNGRFLRTALWPYLHLDQAAIRVGMAEESIVVGAQPPRDIALVHCNHFFCMPVARRLSPSAAKIVETHDVQADQFILLNRSRRVALSPRVSRQTMLERELALLAQADAIIHLNDQEDRLFRALLPRSRRELIYPAIHPVAPALGSDIVIVASGNPANTLDLAWLLSEVLPLIPDLPVQIYGTIGEAIQSQHPALFCRFSHLFLGRVTDLSSVYARAGIILLPCRGGHGLSIKALEALSSGARIVATRHALRGIDASPSQFPNVTLADDALAFARSILQAYHAPRDDRASIEARCAYASAFGASAYASRLGQLATAIMAKTNADGKAICNKRL